MVLPLLSALAFLSALSVAILTDFSPPGWAWFFVVFLLFKRPKVVVILLAILLGFWRVDFYESQATEDVPVGEFVSLEGEVVEEVDGRSDAQKITVQTEYGRVLAEISLYEKVRFGDRVKLSGILERPYEGKSSSYKNYLTRYEIWLVMDRCSVEVVEPADFSLRGSLYDLKNWAQNYINHLYFEPEASFVSGLLLGSRRGMPEDLTTAFQQVGLTHIVAISGYNISLVIAVIFSLFSFLSFKRRIVVSVTAVALFVFFVGASSAAVRAGLMGSLSMWGLYAGRRSQAFFAVLWSAVGMALWNPYIFVYDIGFQLSMASTLGLLTLVPILDSKIPKWERGTFFREAFLLTSSAQITTFPFMLFYFGRISMVSPLINVLVAPFIPLSMLFSFLSLVFGAPAVLLASFYLELIENSALLFSKLPFAQVPLSLDGLGFALCLGFLSVGIISFYKSILVRAFGLSSGEAPSKVLNP